MTFIYFYNHFVFVCFNRNNSKTKRFVIDDLFFDTTVCVYSTFLCSTLISFRVPLTLIFVTFY